jgi:TolB protein
MTIGGYESMLSKKIGILGVVMLLSTVMGACNGGKVKDTDPVSDEKNNNVVVEKVDKYQDMVAVDWLSDTKWIVATATNDKLDNNLLEFDLQTKQKKPLLDHVDSVYIKEAKLSPDKKHIFYEKYLQDITTKKRIQIPKPYHYSSEWVDNQNLIFSQKDEKLYLANVNGKVTIITNQFKGSSPIKMGEQLYFLRDATLHRLDIKTNETQALINGVTSFTLSPKKNQFAVVKQKENEQVLVLTNLEGKEQATVTTAELLGGMRWSPDGSQLAYLLLAKKAHTPSIYIANAKTGKSTHVVDAMLFIVPTPIFWSPSGKQLLINCLAGDRIAAEVQVITLKK